MMTENEKLDAQANKLREEWLAFIRKPIEPWDKIPERVRQSWRLLAGGDYFEKGMETDVQRKFHRRRVQARGTIQS